jgi:hypothetical protein
MEHPKEQLELFDNKRYVRHHFLLPNVVEFPRHVVENNLHDDFIEDLEVDALRAKIFDFPRKLTPPDAA